MGFSVERVEDMRFLDLQQLVEASEREGFRFLTRVVKEYANGKNTFNQRGEALFCVREDDSNRVVAIGGVNQSPFADPSLVGRLRRFYVLEEVRRLGVGSMLLKEIIDFSKGYFEELTVRTDSSKADAFYVANGFDWINSVSDTTHRMTLLSKGEQDPRMLFAK